MKRHGGIQDPAWRSLFEGEEEKTIAQTLKELCDADERSPAHDDLPPETRDAVEETREMRYMMGCGRGVGRAPLHLTSLSARPSGS